MANEGAPNRAIGSMIMGLEEGIEAYDVTESALEELIDLGLRLPERPDSRESDFIDEDGSIIIPTNLVELSDSQLGELYALAERYYAYAAGQLALVKNCYKQSDKQHKFISAKVRLAKDGPAKDKDSRKIVDRRYVLSEAESFKHECLYNLISKVVDAADANLKFISRNISIREQQLKSKGRLASIGARKQQRKQWSVSNGRSRRESEEITAPQRRPSIKRPYVAKEDSAPPKEKKKKRRRAPPRRRTR